MTELETRLTHALEQTQPVLASALLCARHAKDDELFKSIQQAFDRNMELIYEARA